MSIPTNWFEDFFHGITLDLWRQAIPHKQTVAEADFLVKALQCKPGARVLDVPCGNGRLSYELARRGLHATGVDISQEFIAEANSANTSAPATKVDFMLGDMRHIEFDAVFDGAFCFGNSFGFMKFADMEQFLSGVAHSLKPKARFIIETGMAAESVLPDFEEQTSHEIGDMSIIIKERYIAAESCIDSEYIFERDGTSETRLAKHWIYTAAEIQRMLEKAGFKALEFYGSLESEPFKLGSRELILIAQSAERTVA